MLDKTVFWISLIGSVIFIFNKFLKKDFDCVKRMMVRAAKQFENFKNNKQS